MLATADLDESAIMDGEEGVLLEILKVSDANTLDVISAVKSRIDELKGLLGEKFIVKIALDKSELIQNHINQVKFDMILGVVLTTLIVFLFLGSFRATAISALAIPTSILGTFFIIDVLGYDLNRLTLIALTLGIGIFIDDAIVVIENISKNLHGKQIKVDDMGLAWSSELKIARVNLAYNGKIISHFSPKFSYVYNEDLANWFKDFEGREVTLILYTDEDGTREILRVKYTIVPMVEPKPEETVEPKPSEQFKSSKPDEKIKAIEETVPPCPLGMGDDHSPSMQD